ncbi:hypothetical protein K3495_g13396 [Podosphaera aphanis]|nr:hypothetical protein K3495_g13396 [Podosphaera aphanis]
MPDFYPSHRPPPGGSRSLTETLLLTTTSATTRTQEATLMFGNVASAIDEAARGTNYHALPHHLKGTYEKFLYCLQEVAQGFFESHVRGVPQDERTPLKPTQATTSTAQRSTKPL